MDRSELCGHMVKIAKKWCISYRARQVDYSRIRIHFKFYKGVRNHKVGELGHITKNGCVKARTYREKVLCVYTLDEDNKVYTDSHRYGECPRRLYGIKAKEEYARKISGDKRQVHSQEVQAGGV